MNKIEHMAKQQKVLDAFYKDYFKKTNIHFGYWLAAGILLGLSGLLVLFPYQTMSGEDSGIIIVTGFTQLSGAVMYLTAYRTCLNDRGMITPLYSRLQSLPVSVEIVRKYHFNKAFKLQTKIYVALQIGQLFFSIVTQHEVVLGNVLYPLLTCWLLPCTLIALMGITINDENK